MSPDPSASTSTPARDPAPRVDVAAGLVWQTHGADGHRLARPRLLLASRPLPKVYAGWWELPGGKFEPGESAAQALARELHEELGLSGLTIRSRTVLEFDYDHARVRLHFCDAVSALGSALIPRAQEGQQWVWVDAASAAIPSPLLPATRPLIERFRAGEWQPWGCAPG